MRSEQSAPAVFRPFHPAPGLLGVALAVIFYACAGNLCNAQSPAPEPSTLSPDLQEVVKLSQQQMSDDVIISYIKNSGKSYKLSADDLIYLKNQGVSQNVIITLEQSASASAAPQAPEPSVPPPQAPDQSSTVVPIPGPPPPVGTATEPTPAPEPVSEVNFDYFHDQLAPYGTWVYVAPYGWCWRPDAALAANPEWRPYYDMGQWVYTENGWFWQSDYTWGDIPFHYGNWVMVPGRGWLWVPGYTWGPAWVFWRHDEADGYIGWAPLPWGAIFVNGGWFYHGVHYGVNFDFGLGESVFVFADYGHFHDMFFRMRGHEYPFFVPRARADGLYRRSVVRNNFRRDAHGWLINDGIGRERVERLTNHREEVAHFEERNPVGNRDRLADQRMANAARAGGVGANRQTGQPEQVNKVFRPPERQRNR